MYTEDEYDRAINGYLTEKSYHQRPTYVSNVTAYACKPLACSVNETKIEFGVKRNWFKLS